MSVLGRRWAIVSLALVACGRHGARCAFCGMPIDAHSAFTTTLVTTSGDTVEFDSPRCALLAWRTGQVQAKSLHAQDYYDRAWHDGADLRFVVSSDVMGPMGPDIVPVDPARAAQFAREHTGTRPLPLDAITLELLRDIH